MDIRNRMLHCPIWKVTVSPEPLNPALSPQNQSRERSEDNGLYSSQCNNSQNFYITEGLQQPQYKNAIRKELNEDEEFSPSFHLEEELPQSFYQTYEETINKLKVGFSK